MEWRGISLSAVPLAAALTGREWTSAEKLPQQRGGVLPTPPQGGPVRRCTSFHDYCSPRGERVQVHALLVRCLWGGSQSCGSWSTGAHLSTSFTAVRDPSPSTAARMSCGPHSPLSLPHPLSKSASHDPLPRASSRTISRRCSISTERVSSLFTGRKRRSSGDFLVGSEGAAMFAVYSPRQEDLEAVQREQEWEGQLEGVGPASDGGTNPVQVCAGPFPLSLSRRV